MDSSLVDNYNYKRITTATVDAQENVFRTAVDLFSADEWNDIVADFDDAAIYQTSVFGALCWGTEKLSRIAIYEGDEVVAAAQVVIVDTPLLGAGIAHCKFGPLWRRRDAPVRTRVYREILQALRSEYADRRGLLLRIKPWEISDSAEQYSRQRQLSDLNRQSHLPKYSTFVLDLSRSIDELRSGLHRRWRYNLRQAEKLDIQITRSTSKEDAATFEQLRSEMRTIKTYVDTSEVEHLPSLMAGLPGNLKPSIFIAYRDGKPLSSLVVSAIGHTAFYLYAASGREGRQISTSYLLFWEALKWAKEGNCRWLDLVGSTPRGTGGHNGYRQFKNGFTGRNGSEHHMCDWEVSGGWHSTLVVHGGTYISECSRAARHGLNALKVRLSRYPAGTKA
jgi:peptidoglycan pentaglycine glycine transferase (the first glycine)